MCAKDSYKVCEQFNWAKAQTAALREMLHIAWMNAAGEIYRTFLCTFYAPRAGTYERFFLRRKSKKVKLSFP